MALFATACASSDRSGSNETDQSSGVAAAEAPADDSVVDSTPPATDANWPTAVASFVAYDLERQVIMDHAGMLIRGDDPAVEQWEIRCNWIDDQARLALDARPATPSDASAAWVKYIESVETYWTSFQQACADSDASALAADPSLSAEVWASYDERLAVCEALLIELESLSDDAPAVFCEPPLNVSVPVETYDDLPQELADAFRGGGGGDDDEEASPPRDDVNPTDGPTGEELTLLPPGSNTFEWFQPVFTINNESPWLVEAQSDRILILDRPEEPPNAVVELMGPGGLADPDQLVRGEDWTTGPVPTIAVPEDLTAWVEAMPVVGTPTPLTIGGVDATYWKLDYDRTAEGNSVIVYAWQELDGALAVGLSESLHLWHVPRPDGSLLFVEMEFPGEGPPERQATQLFEFFSFE